MRISLAPALLLLLVLVGCSDGDGDDDGDSAADKAWLQTDVCALLPDGTLEQVVEDPASVHPEPRTPEDIAADKPAGVPDTFGDNQTECTWGEPTLSDGLTLQLFDPPFPELFTDTESEDAITEPLDVEGGTAFVTRSGSSCDLSLPSEPAWVTVDVSPYDDDLLDDVEPDACAIAADVAVAVADSLGWRTKAG